MLSPADFLRANRDAIIATWADRARSLPHAGALPRLLLLDHLPELLDAIAARLDNSGERLAVLASALEHAVDRCRNGVPLREVASEYGILREVIEEMYEAHTHARVPKSLGLALADAMAETIDLYDRACEEQT